MKSDSREIIARLAAHAEKHGWRNAVLECLTGEPALFQYVLDERAGDWRFLLRSLPKGSALCLGGALSPVPLTLASTCARVVVVAGGVEARFLRARLKDEGITNVQVRDDEETRVTSRHKFDLVCALRPAPGSRGSNQTAISRVSETLRPGGEMYIEVDRPAVFAPPHILKLRLLMRGFSRSAFYWPKPDFARCEMLMPLGDTRLQTYYLSNTFFAMSRERRALRGALSLLSLVGLFEFTLPSYCVVAGREGKAKE